MVCCRGGPACPPSKGRQIQKRRGDPVGRPSGLLQEYERWSKMMVLVPLFNFNWDGDQFELAKLGKIQRFQNIPDLSNFKTHLTEFDKDKLRDVKYWLLFEQQPTDTLSESEKINFFLLALWMALPTETQVNIIFKSSEAEYLYTISRCLDIFQSDRLSSIGIINNKLLEKVNEYINNIMDIYLNPKRLFNSLILNLLGNFAYNWQSSFICYSSAMEAILTYSKSKGLTDRLAKSFACLTEIDKPKRDIEFINFRKLYKIRSNIMHGRAMNYTNPKDNLEKLNEFEMLLRKIWKTILSSKNIIAELEKSDADRKIFFDKIEKGYKPPSI
jgi:hypothetical protein